MSDSLILPATNNVLQALPPYIRALTHSEKTRSIAERVDGLIIGTGEADFTKGNTRYQLNVRDQTFELLDVPGIEGDESRYVEEVKKAVAAAHLVVYVNGTNKKPEKHTSYKIGSYLKRGTQVLPLINIRGNADAYEFEEDRVDLLQHGNATNALQQTTEVLEATLGEKVLMSGEVVQGLMAFSSLAINANGSTTIHPSRNHDLLIQQRNYRKYFASDQEMIRFSRIDSLAGVVRAKLTTWQQDIFESNKMKVSELLNDYLQVLEDELIRQDKFMHKAAPEFEKCRIALNNAISGFENRVKNHWSYAWEGLFDTLIEKADEIVDEHFGDETEIKRRITIAFERSKKQSEKAVFKSTEDDLATLQQRLQQALNRLQQDIHNAQLQPTIAINKDSDWRLNTRFEFDSELGIGDLGDIAVKIGSYVLSGMTIGSLFPVLGTVIGGIIGGLVGVLVSAVGILQSRAKKIRKAQSQVRAEINSVRSDVLASLSAEVSSLVNSIRNQIHNDLLQRVDAIQAALNEPKIILIKQKKLISHIKNQLEKMPHGCIDTIQY